MTCSLQGGLRVYAQVNMLHCKSGMIVTMLAEKRTDGSVSVVHVDTPPCSVCLYHTPSKLAGYLRITVAI